MKKCLVFPGQGSQAIGMGKDLYTENTAAREVFDTVDAALGEKFSSLIFDGSAEDLNLTKNVQPAIFAVSMAMLAAAKDKIGQVDFVAGHSLGEYSALCAAGAINVADAVRLLRKRGEFMQSAVPTGGAMAVIIGDVDVPAVCAEAAGQTGKVVEPANDNSPGQFVISGHSEAVEKAMEVAKSKGAKIVKKLAVSVPAHCSLMEPITDKFREAKDSVNWFNPKIQFISNKTAQVMPDLEEIKESLVYQLTHGVRWRETVLGMAAVGINEVIEVGPGNVLTGLVGRIDNTLNSYKLEV